MDKRKYTTVFLGWLVLITSLSLFSFEDAGEQKVWLPHMDKVVHFSFHFGIMVLGILFLKEIYPQWQWRKKITRLLLFSLGYGLLIEVLQWVMPFGRSAEYWDILANGSGAVLGGLLIQKSRLLIERLK